MGEVYVGFDEKLERRVAVKALRASHRIDRQRRARFLREAKVLSQLHHSNICQLFDYIEADGFDILVLELIEGRNLREAIKEGLSQTERERIAEDLLSVLAVAHEKGVIHRDLKPSNVMLTREGEVKVLDFGLARRIALADTDVETPLEGDPLYIAGQMTTGVAETKSGALLGTPAYMSPEQFRGEVATTASDMYSMGLLLQELFTGEPAYPRGVPLVQLMVQVLRADHRPIEGLDGDLTELIQRLKALQPGTRPSAVDALARIRWIRDKPRRRLRRRLGIGALAAMVVVLIVVSYQAVRIAREATRANREAVSARRVSSLLEDVFLVSDPSQNVVSDATTRAILDQRTKRVLAEPSLEPEIRVRLLSTIAAVYRSIGSYERANDILAEALRQGASLDPRNSVGLGQLHFEIGLVARYLDDPETARRHHAKSLEIRKRVLGREHPDTIRSLLGLAHVLSLVGEEERARDHLEEALATLTEISPEPSGDLADAHHGLGIQLLEIAESGGIAADRERGLELLRKGLEINESIYGADHPEVAWSKTNLGIWLHREGRSAEAESLLRSSLDIKRKALGPRHASVAASARNLAVVLLDVGRTAEATELARLALGVNREHFPESHWQVGYVETILGACLVESGATEEGITLLRRGLATLTQQRGPSDMLTVRAGKRLDRYLHADATGAASPPGPSGG
jgi:serine/threonine-protein kinase